MYVYDRPTNKGPGEFTGYMLDETAVIKTFDPSAQYRSKAFTEAMEYFDTHDTLTRNVLLSVNEADQNNIMNALANKLYKHIVDKVDDIDFGTIPATKGDITKIEHYDELNDCISVISQIMQQYHQPTETIEIVQAAVANMVDRVDLFTKAYRLNIELPIVLYNTIALSIVSAVSYLIASCIEFIKLPKDAGFEIALDKAALSKSKDHVLFTNLARFNHMCDKHDVEKIVDYVISQNAKGLVDYMAVIGISVGIAGAAAVIGAIIALIHVVRNLVFLFYYTKVSISTYFETQADLLTMNAYNVENNLTRDEATRKKIAAKQRKIADKFKKISDKFKVDMKSGEGKASKEAEKEDSKKNKIGDVVDKVPDSSNGSIF